MPGRRVTGGDAPGTPRALGPADLADVAGLWNATFRDHHPLGDDGLRRWWGSPDTDEALTFGVEAGGRLVGALLARAPVRAWAPPGVGHVSLLAVAPEAWGGGVGAALWGAARDALRARGRHVLRLGTDPDHLLPGVPAVAPARTWRFLRRRGVRFGALEADIVLDLRDGPPPAPRLAVRVEPAPERVVAAVRGWFPGRWADEVERAAERGTALLVGLAGDEPIGFAVASRPGDAVVGPGLVWARSLGGRAGGLGPLGVDPARRGAGLGTALVAAAARWHADAGTEQVVFDWTSLAAFYGRLGARVWRVYQRGEAGGPG